MIQQSLIKIGLYFAKSNPDSKRICLLRKRGATGRPCGHGNIAETPLLLGVMGPTELCLLTSTYTKPATEVLAMG